VISFGLNSFLALLGYGCLPLAWWAERSGRTHWPALAIVLCATLLRLSASLDPFLHPWDERYHALVGKHLAEDMLTPVLYPDARLPHDPANWTCSHIWVHKPPFTLWCIALSIDVLGTTPLAVRLPSIILSALAALLLFQLGTAMISRSVGLWAGLLFAINGHLLELASGRTSTDHVDAVFVAVILIALWAAWRMFFTRSSGWALATGVLAGVAFLTKSWPALVIVPVTVMMISANKVLLVRSGWKLLLIMSAGALFTALPWVLYAHHRFSAESAITDAAIWTRFSVGLDTHSRPWHYYLLQLPMMHGAGVVVVLPWALRIWWKERSRTLATLLTWILVPLVVFSFAETKMPAYTAIAAPAWCLLIGMCMIRFWYTSTVRTWERWASRIVAGLLFALPVQFSLNRLKPWEQPDPKYIIADHWMNAPPNTVVVDCPYPIELMFHTRIAAAYVYPLDTLAVRRLRYDGYSVVRFPDAGDGYRMEER